MSDQRFNTGNPIGSNSPLDRSDNTRNLDLAVNSSVAEWSDRFGQSRLTFAGMQSQFSLAQELRNSRFQIDQVSREQRFNTFIASSGYQFLGDYGPDIEFTEYNQLVRDENGEFWRVSGQVDLPYVTTGDGIPEGDALVPAGDAVLRQDLTNPVKGAAMVARGVVAVESYNALTLLPADQKRSDLRYLVCGSVFRWDDVKTMFVPEGPVKMAAFGAGRGGDDTAAFQQANAYFRSLGYADIDFEDKSYYINVGYGLSLDNLSYFRARGTGAQITHERQTQEGGRVIFHLVGVPYVLVEGIRFTMRVLDNSTPITDGDSRGYPLRASNPNLDAPFGNPGHVFIARNNTFIDEVGIPNFTTRPFNGCIQASGYGSVRILDNEFINGVGRVCYVNDSTNVVITRNRFKNLNYTPFPVSTPLGTLGVRVLSSRGVRIYDNDFEVADENNHTVTLVIFTLTFSSQYPNVMCEDVRIFENRIKAKNCDSIWGVRASFCRNVKVYGNTFNGNPDAAGSSRFFFIEPLTNDSMAVYDVQVYENTIDPAYPGVIQQATGAIPRSGEITVYGNHLKFHSEVVDAAIDIPGEYEGVLGNKVYLDGELQGDVSGNNYYDPNAIGERRLRIDDSNMSNYVDLNGVLKLPKDVGIIAFNTLSNVDITDITVGGAKPFMRSILLYNERMILTNSPILKHSSNIIRLPGNADYNLSVAPIRLLKPSSTLPFWIAV